MCGILAVFCSSTPKQLKEIILGGKQLESRGPDRCSSIIKSDGIYIFRRLCIVDTSTRGDQPMVSGKITMMCNGEIYNHKELEEEYELKCESKSDCEVILRLYEKIGFVETVKRLDGVFAIVLVDGDKVYLARDRIGVRPLFFGLTQERYLAVASTPNALSGFCSPISSFEPGATALHIKKKGPSDGQIQLLTYLQKDGFYISDQPIENKTVLHDTLVDSVRKRLMTDRPIGCLLSGGLDSSIITAILVKLLGKEKVRTYSIGMEGSTDLKYARKVADFLETEHHEVTFTPEEGFAVIPEIIRVSGTHDITTIRASVGMYLISKYISENSDDIVIFSGEGSDELLCGYLYFHNAPTPEDATEESLRLIKQLHLYDVLRADRTVSSNGLELRVPFLDRNMVDLALCLKEQRVPQKGMEKYILRNAFEGYLPHDVLWRRKEGFSDGVSGVKKSWYSHIQEMVEPLIPDIIFSTKYPSKEAMYYRLLFDKFYPTYKLEVPYWMPKWSNATDPSGRLIEAYDEE
jgi:asparagine synthase (glutamine-hydrolysing)